MEGINLSAFFAGAATAYYAIHALQILSRPERTRFQTAIGWIFVVWTLLNFKDIIITFPEYYNEQTLNYILVADGWSAVTYTVFIFELTMPGWTTTRRVLLTCLPFAALTLSYILWPTRLLLNCYVAFLVVYALSILAIAFYKAQKYIRYIRNNYSNIDEIDISWLKYVFFFFIVGQLSWLFTSLEGKALVDTIYYVTTIAMWQLALHYSLNLKPITIVAEPVSDSRSYNFADTINEVMEQQELYLNYDLTINDLAKAIGTNRTYLSQYFNTVKHTTFYDYINQLRITKKSIPLMQQHPEYTLEYVAAKSGFKSISTFRRAFLKLTGSNPRQYRWTTQ